MPVHAFILRHVYCPALRAGFTSIQAQIIAFLISAIGHELLISVPAHMFKLHAFFGMLGQIPLIALTKFVVYKYKNAVFGNVVFWISFLTLGQPIIVLLYATQYLQSK